MSDGWFWDGYLHWAYDLERYDPEFESRDGDPDLYEPIFIRLCISEPFGDKVEKVRAKLEDILTNHDPADGYRNQVEDIPLLNFLPDFGYDLIELVIGFQHAVVEGTLPEFFIYRRVARTLREHNRYKNTFMVLDVGAPARVNLRPKVAGPPPIKPVLPPPAIGAVIDNDIGYLHRSLCDGNDSTRIAAIWLQAREQFIYTAPSPFPQIHIGQVLTLDDVTDLIKRYGRNERQAYATVNTGLHTRAAFKQPPPIAAHGAMVTNLAFGDGDKTGTSDVPLLAVQLPPEAAYDTSGTTSESYIVQGVRWICFWARVLNEDVPVIINVSYGVLAGQKDGGKFLEAQIAREIEIAKKYPANGGKGQSVEVVFAFGNSRNTRQVADFTVEPGATETLTWFVPANNPGPAFLEVRAVASRGPTRLVDLPSDVTVSLKPPGEPAIAVTGTEGQAEVSAVPPVKTVEGTVPVRLYNTPHRKVADRPEQPGYTLAAIAPTRPRSHNQPAAKAGDWALSLRNDGADPVRIVLQVQRGDTAPGFRSGWRQSRLEGRMVSVVEDGVAGQTVEPPLTNAGTSSAYVNQASFETAGAGRDVFSNTVPAPYSGEGADWTLSINPKALPVVDRAFTQGVATGGAYSGTRARLSGTSAAAALRTRELIK
ncbi:S8 family serine peptidase [uncultured Roseobacter sp.]|uniref:S8 family serine peptidase n=1 Tax=uncultured Roseobacter sp. TaxID=114847 RepID=UPI002612BEA8|nr:S8 family serine peptidase [uncultured Roseobacter sp.]